MTNSCSKQKRVHTFRAGFKEANASRLLGFFSHAILLGLLLGLLHSLACFSAAFILITFALLSALGSNVRTNTGDLRVLPHCSSKKMDYCAGGLWGAGAATLNKFAFRPSDDSHVLYFDSWQSRLAFFVAAVYCNGKMFKCYADLLRHMSALQASLVQFGANVIGTGLFGYVLFGDRITLKWCLGSCLLCAGIWLLSSSPNKSK
eukprot:Blabericola_migrator_1__9437@NODE_510_length_7944_cov_147_881554_g391_i0_p7_GENE_NODE_510_length_7944_cov_147_881554_g391_i0NODE_510_length_7944_cov_147_881554_g391_i0_p7_ORF_typecomplete_len204_score14_33EamA/PF00892_20/0_00039Multi_Drug_Res/PF00893_19/3_4e02Multi_Drug_Res/PF00893_19/0_002Nuc_sug_transp/PF04142_15/1_2e03Nuc_sug_transp/PF04142_15/0_011zfC2H2_4/PF13894_6/0_068DUF1700/PF08006_11/0_41DUF1700/PF08006_11/4_7e02_NODE_510_length_7944_cov_147_881554_g391_i042974908